MVKTKKSYDLHLENDEEWQCLKMALCHLHHISSCYDSLSFDHRITRDLLVRIGVWSIFD